MAFSAVLIVVLAVTGLIAALLQGLAVAERTRSRASGTLFAVGWALLVFIPLAWGLFGGQTAWYVQAVGAYDFAGAIPFHLGGGVAALAVTILVPREAVSASPLRQVGGLRAVLALIIIACGWVGWLALMEFQLNHFVATIIGNSALLAGASLVAALLVQRVSTRKTTVGGAAVGVFSGLAAATGACVFLEPVAAVITGLIVGASAAGVAFRRKAQVPSLAGLIAVTGLTGGVIGLAMVGLLEPTRGFFYTGAFGLASAQLTSVAVCLVYSALVCIPLSLIVRAHARRGVNRWAIPDSNR